MSQKDKTSVSEVKSTKYNHSGSGMLYVKESQGCSHPRGQIRGTTNKSRGKCASCGTKLGVCTICQAAVCPKCTK